MGQLDDLHNPRQTHVGDRAHLDMQLTLESTSEVTPENEFEFCLRNNEMELEF